ncbi:MAG: M16 family metallopeptidase [Hyphomonadaceae bacterium]
MGVTGGLELVRLSNGVRVALDPMAGLETAALGVWQSVGARWEAPHENGVAHLFEHMAFKGAGGRDAKQFAEAVESVGASLNAATGYEHTSYFARMIAKDAPFALDLIADILFKPHWEEADFVKEKDVVAQERGEAFDFPSDRVFEIHQAALFPDQPLGRPILGEAATLDPMHVSALEAFRNAHLSPDRLVISIAGGFDRAAILDAAEKRFAHLAPKPRPAREPARPVAAAVGEARQTEETHLVLSWPAPPAGDPRAMAMRLFAEIFGGGMSSRLFQEIREARGLVYSIYASVDAYEDVGRLIVSTGCRAMDARAVVDLVNGALQSLASEGPGAAELLRAKAGAAASLLMGAEAPSARAEARAMQVLLRDALEPFDAMRARIEAATAGDVQTLAQMAAAGPACISVVGPKTGLGALAAFQAI